MTIVGTPRAAQVSRESLARFAAPAGVSASLAAATLFIVARNPHETQLSFGCLMFNAVGVYCPGCGGTRAVHDVFTGDFAGALHMNALVTLLVIPLGIAGLLYWFARSAGYRLPSFNPPMWVTWTAVGVVAAFWVVRNMPGLIGVLSPLTA